MSTRTQRLAELIHHEIAQLLVSKVQDQRLRYVTITHVDVSNDLSSARVYFSVLDQAKFDVAKAKAAMNSATGYLRRELGQRIDARIIPRLSFFFDQGIASGVAMIQKINDIARQEGCTPSAVTSA